MMNMTTTTMIIMMMMHQGNVDHDDGDDHDEDGNCDVYNDLGGRRSTESEWEHAFAGSFRDVKTMQRLPKLCTLEIGSFTFVTE